MQTQVSISRRVPRWALPLHLPARYKGAKGGRGSGKSHEFAEMAVERMVCDPHLRFVCIREVQSSLEFSAKSLVEAKIKSLGVSEHFDVMKTQIRRKNGSGIMIFEGMQDHTADTLKSLEGFGVAWVEEAQSISQKSLDILLPTIRAEGSEVWFSWNPKIKTDPVDVFFSSGGDSFVLVHTTYLDNPFCPSVLRAEAKRAKAEDEDKYNHIWLGAYDLGGKGRVYSKFVNKPYPVGNVDASVHDHGGDLFIGQDFNVNPMCSVVSVRVGDECHVIDALAIPTSNTDEMCKEIRARYPNRRVTFCPDPAGNARHTNAPFGQTDFTIIASYGFQIDASTTHPAVVDRINNVNMMLCHDERRRLRIHPRAGVLVEALSSQVFKDGTSLPDKKGGFDHPNDALGYLCWQQFNLLTPRAAWGVSQYKAGARA